MVVVVLVLVMAVIEWALPLKSTLRYICVRDKSERDVEYHCYWAVMTGHLSRSGRQDTAGIRDLHGVRVYSPS